MRLLGAIALIALAGVALLARRPSDQPSRPDDGAARAFRSPQGPAGEPEADRARIAELSRELQEFARELRSESSGRLDAAVDGARGPGAPQAPTPEGIGGALAGSVRIWDGKRGRVYELPRKALEGELPPPDELWEEYGIGTYDGSSRDGRTYDIQPRRR